MINIGMDAMGGDFGPAVTVQAASNFLHNHQQVQVTLYGHCDLIQKYITTSEPRLQIVHTTEQITDTDHPVKVIQQKRDSSLVVGARALKNNLIDIFVSAGNTGAVLAASVAIIGLIDQIKRPTFAVELSTLSAATPKVLLVDSGANIDSPPQRLVEFAELGSAYAQKTYKLTAPRVGLLNNGTESNKGSQTAKEAFRLLKQHPWLNFIGNIEPNTILAGPCDILVADGYVGNLVLKTLEGTSAQILQEMHALIKNSQNAAGDMTLMAQQIANQLQAKLDPRTAAGGIALGTKKPILCTHGDADAYALEIALNRALTIVAANQY